jgi:leucyl aminopeptidase
VRTSVRKAAGWRGKVVMIPAFAGSTTPAGLPGGAVPEELGQASVVVNATKSPMAVVMSAGKSAEFNLEKMRCVGGAISKWMRAWKVDRVGVDLRQEKAFGSSEAIGALCEGLNLGAFTFDRHRQTNKTRGRQEAEVLVDRLSAESIRSARRAGVVSAAVNLSRELAHEPPNLINPVTLVTRVRAVARRAGLKCTVLDEKRLAALKMGGLLSVGKGSATPPRLIVLEHRGRRAEKPVVVVGKTITFDTGGYSLKPRDNITGMKYDKCGGMQVLGLMQAVAALKYPRRVVGILAAAENMISAQAYRPDDIIRTMSGKTVQIVSADAEGRMVLCDALTYAQKTYAPRCLIDVATLTGGVLVALGRHAAGVFANDEKLQEALIEAGRRTHERLWPLPMWDDYFTLIKGEDSDLKNSGGRDAQAVCGAVFLKQFVDAKVPWAHLDIAGVADIENDGPYCPKGATGFGVRLLLDWLEHL